MVFGWGERRLGVFREEEFEVIFHHAGAGDDGEVGAELAVDFGLELVVVAEDLAGVSHLRVKGVDFGVVVGAKDFEDWGGVEVGDAAVWGGNEDFEVSDVFHEGCTAGFEADYWDVDGDVGADGECEAELFIVILEVVDTFAEEVVGVDGGENFLEAVVHFGVAEMDFAR